MSKELMENLAESVVRKFISEADDSVFPVELHNEIVKTLIQHTAELKKKLEEIKIEIEEDEKKAMLMNQIYSARAKRKVLAILSELNQ